MDTTSLWRGIQEKPPSYSGLSKHVYVATGYFADGLSYGTIAGILLADLILEKKNPWSEIYNPTRFTPVFLLLYAFQS